jgi:hypothetical protein
MIYLKTLNGIKIWVNIFGEFYCDILSNSPNYSQKTHCFEKLTDLEAVINKL